MQINKKYFMLLVFIAIPFILGLNKFDPIKLKAVQNVENCKSVDLVILIDQSGSMENTNDRDGFRVDAAQNIIQRLALNALIECPEAIHRIAVGYFGDNFEWVNFSNSPGLTVNMVKLGSFQKYIENNDSQKWQQEVVNPILEKITPEYLGSTNTLEAIRTAPIFLNSLSIEGNLERKRVVILLTDGFPWPIENGADHYFEDILQVLNNQYPAHEIFSPQDIDFWVVALNNASIDTNEDSQPTNYLAVNIRDLFSPQSNEKKVITVEQFWKNVSLSRHGDLKILTKNRNEIPDALNFIYEKILGKAGFAINCSENPFFYVDPYIASAWFTFSKNRADIVTSLEYYGNKTTPQLTFRNGQILDEKGNLIEDFRTPSTDHPNKIVNWSESGRLEFYKIANPKPGRWKIVSTSCPDTRTRFEPINVISNLLSPIAPLPVVKDPPYYDSQSPAYLQIEVIDDPLNPLPIILNPDYPINIVAKYQDSQGNYVLSPNNTEEWELDSIGNGIWQSHYPLKLANPGNYQLDIVATAPSANPENSKPVALFENTNLNFEVLDVDRFDFKIISPTSNSEVAANYFDSEGKIQGSPIQVKVRVENPDGSSISSSNVFLSNHPFTAVLKNKAGNEVSAKTILEPGSGIGEFFADIYLSDPLSLDVNSLEISLDITKVNTNKFLPVKNLDSVIVSRKTLDSFSLQWIEPNESIPLHKRLFKACGPWEQTEPIFIKLRLESLTNHEQVNPEDIVFKTNDANSLIVGQLQGPPNDQGIRPDEGNIVFKLAPDPDGTGTILEAQTGKILKNPGEYLITVDINGNILNENFIVTPGTIPLQFTVQRLDSFWTSPTTCKGVDLSIIVLILIIVGLLIYGFTGGAGGTLIFQDQYGNEVHIVKLPKRRWFATVKSSALETGFGIMEIKSQKATGLDEQKNVFLEILGEDGEELWIGNLEPNQSYPLTSELDMEYRG